MAKKLDPKEVAADKALATKEYHADRQAALDRIAGLRAARLARDANAASTPKKEKQGPGKGRPPRAK